MAFFNSNFFQDAIQLYCNFTFNWGNRWFILFPSSYWPYSNVPTFGRTLICVRDQNCILWFHVLFDMKSNYFRRYLKCLFCINILLKPNSLDLSWVLSFRIKIRASMSTAKKVLVIGAGASGLPAIKTALEYGFMVVCYEKAKDIGGLWRFKSAPEPGR